MSLNTSGVIGVYWDNTHGYWTASLQKDKTRVFQKHYSDFDSAVIARLNAEVKYFGEFAPQKHLFDQYGIIASNQEDNNELQQSS